MDALRARHPATGQAPACPLLCLATARRPCVFNPLRNRCCQCPLRARGARSSWGGGPRLTSGAGPPVPGECRHRRRPCRRPCRHPTVPCRSCTRSSTSPDRLAGSWGHRMQLACSGVLFGHHAATCLASCTCSSRQGLRLHASGDVPCPSPDQDNADGTAHGSCILLFARPEPGRNRAAQVAGSRPPLPLSSGVSTRVTGAPAAAVQAGACGP